MSRAKLEPVDTQSRILCATLDCLKRHGLEKTSMSDIAKTAGITRPTLYKYFKSKMEAIYAAIDTVAYHFAESVVEHAKQFDTLEARIVETIVYVVQEFPRDEHLSLVLRDEMASDLRSRAFSDEATVVFSQMTAVPLVEIEPKLEEQGVEISEIMSRFAISMILFPGRFGSDFDGLRGLIKRRLIPGLITHV